MKIVLDDLNIKTDLYPLTQTRSVVDIRIGILTIREKWEALLHEKITLLSQSEDININSKEIKIVSANIVPSRAWLHSFLKEEISHILPVTITQCWHIFQNNKWALQEDFKLLSSSKTSKKLSATNQVINADNIFIEEGAIVEHCIINAATGPVYIAKNALIMEGCLIRGPFSLGEKSVLKMGTKIYGATTVGPNCVIGGEVKNSVFFGNSNKAHDGYLGDSVIGEWCMLGAGTTGSNIKNTASPVNVWSDKKEEFLTVGLNCGLIMGDYSRAAINTSFNTGTVVGVCCNVLSRDFPPKYIADFTWGEERYDIKKAFDDINNWKKLKGKSITDEEIKILSDIYAKNEQCVIK